MSSQASMPLGNERAFLDVRDLKVHFPTDDGIVRAVNGVSFKVERGQTLGIVGESGSGKSVTSLAIMGLHRGTGADIGGEIWLGDTELLASPPDLMRKKRGNQVAMIFQDPLSAMHPYYRVGEQLVEAYRVHNKVTKAVAKKTAVEMLDRVGIPSPDKRFSDYPHQFSGGMRQRAMIAMAMICNPELLIADEPTTALDVTVQAQILDLMVDLQREFNSAIIIITHDLGVVAQMSGSIAVMYGGRVVERGTARDIFYTPEHPYAWGLLGSIPRLNQQRGGRLVPIKGSPPSLINIPPGCPFHPRCDHRAHVDNPDRCSSEVPELLDIGTGHSARCHIDPAARRQLFTEQIKPNL